MDGIVTLLLLALLCAFLLRRVSGKLGLPSPTTMAVVIVFVLVVAALWGQSLD